MSVEMKLGRWRARDGCEFEVFRHNPNSRWPWESTFRSWDDGGYLSSKNEVYDADLIEYLGPLSPTPASAEAGPAGYSTVSTEDRQEQLKRMRERFVDIQREVRIYSDLLPALERAMYDVEELIKRLEKEVEG